DFPSISFTTCSKFSRTVFAFVVCSRGGQVALVTQHPGQGEWTTDCFPRPPCSRQTERNRIRYYPAKRSRFLLRCHPLSKNLSTAFRCALPAHNLGNSSRSMRWASARAGQPGRAPPSGGEPEPDLDETHVRVLGGDAPVAGQGHLAAAAARRAFHGRQDDTRELGE